MGADCEAGGFPSFMGSILLDPPETPSLIAANCYNLLTTQTKGWTAFSNSWNSVSDSPVGNCVEK